MTFSIDTAADHDNAIAETGTRHESNANLDTVGDGTVEKGYPSDWSNWPVPAPTHYWPFDEGTGTTAADVVGASDATLNGPTWTTGALGTDGISNDGVDDYTDTGVIPSGTGTVVWWTNPDNAAGSTNEHYLSMQGTGDDFKLQNFDDGNTYWGWNVSDTFYRIVTGDAFPTGTFMVTFAWDDTTGDYALYWDGTLKGSASDLPTISNIAQSSLFLAARNEGGGFYGGHAAVDVDEVLYWDGTMLTQSDVTALYEALV